MARRYRAGTGSPVGVPADAEPVGVHRPVPLHPRCPRLPVQPVRRVDEQRLQRDRRARGRRGAGTSGGLREPSAPSGTRRRSAAGWGSPSSGTCPGTPPATRRTRRRAAPCTQGRRTPPSTPCTATPRSPGTAGSPSWSTPTRRRSAAARRTARHPSGRSRPGRAAGDRCPRLAAARGRVVIPPRVAPGPPGRRVVPRGLLPFRLGRQPPPGPPRVRVRLVPAHVQHRLVPARAAATPRTSTRTHSPASRRQNSGCSSPPAAGAPSRRRSTSAGRRSRRPR